MLDILPSSLYSLFMGVTIPLKKPHSRKHFLLFDFSRYILNPPFVYEFSPVLEDPKVISGSFTSAIPIVLAPGGKIRGFIISTPGFLSQLQSVNADYSLLIGKSYSIKAPGFLRVSSSARKQKGDDMHFVGVYALRKPLAGSTGPIDRGYTTPPQTRISGRPSKSKQIMR